MSWDSASPQRLIRKTLSLVGKPALDNYYREYYQSVKEGLKEYEITGRDLLFHGATALIIVATKPGGSCPFEDALLATQNILLGAHSMGLGTCLIGFAVDAIKNDTGIQRFLTIPEEETVCSVIAIGYPDEKYEGLAGRKKFVMRYFEV